MSSHVVRTALLAVGHRKKLAEALPWTSTPLIVGAPMRILAGPQLAVAVSRAGGLGFLGPTDKPESTLADLVTATGLLSESAGLASSAASRFYAEKKLLPIGLGFLLWNDNIDAAASAVATHRPCAVWLFAPHQGQKQVDTWTHRFREVSPQTQIWLQVGTLMEAMEAAASASPPDVLVIQGSEAGGHGRAEDGIGLTSLLPEVADATAKSGIPLVAAGGIADGRGVVSALGLGAAGAAMGTRFLASHEARIKKGYQNEVVRAADGAASTARTLLYNHLRGTYGWPKPFSPRGLTNKSWEDHQAGVSFDELKRLHDEAVKLGDAAWGPEGRVATYAGASVGLVRGVGAAEDIVKTTREEAVAILDSLRG